MTVPNFKEYNQILADMMNDLAGKGTRITDMNPGSIVRTLLEVVSARFDESHFIAEQIVGLFFAASTTGVFLERRAAERGLTRFPGSNAAGILRVSRSTPAPFTQVIPQGTRFETEDRSVLVETLEEASLLEGTTATTIPVKAVTPGASGNLQAGIPLKQTGVAVSLIENTVVEEPGLRGGAAPETDEELRARYLTILRSPGTSGNKADYVKWALEVSGVGGVDVLPLWAGNGTVKVFLLGMDKKPATQEIVDAVQTYIDPVPAVGEGKAPVGATVTCVAAPALVVDITATVILDGTQTLDQVETVLAGLLTKYLKEIAFSLVDTTVRYSYVGSLILDIAGVVDYSALLINGSTANVPVDKGSVAVLGTVVLS